LKLSITGHSSCGKTSLAGALGEQLGWKVLSQDSYWRRGFAKMEIVRNGRKIRVFDHPALYDSEALAQGALKHENVIMEGFSILHYPSVFSMTDLHFHMDVPWAVCAARRRLRADKRPSDESWFDLGRDWHSSIQWLQRNLSGAILLPNAPVAESVEAVLRSLSEPVCAG
jgi:cytidylate kinase